MTGARPLSPRLQRGLDAVLAAFALAAGAAAAALWAGAGSAFRALAGGPTVALLATMLALLAAAALWLPSEVRARLALMVAAIGLSLAAAEVALMPDLAAKRDALGDLRARDPGAVPALPPAHFLRTHAHLAARELIVGGRPAFPLAGVSRALTLDCRERDGWLAYTTDEHGFRNPAGLWTSPAQVVLVGDSFAHGQCVQEGATVTDRIRARHPRTLSLGYSGNGPLTALAGLRESLPVLRPRAVLWLYFSGNDLTDLSVESTHPVLRLYREDPAYRQGVLERQAEVDRGLRAVIQRAATARPAPEPWWRDALLLRHLRSRLALGPAGGQALAGPQFGNAAFAATGRDVAAFEGVLAQARRETERAGGRLLFVYLPAWTELLPPQPDERIVRGMVLAAVARTGLPVVDLLPAFADAEDPAALFACRRTCHYNARGYALAAERMLAALEGRR
jgi:lysophospholipase L1-like esterase